MDVFNLLPSELYDRNSQGSKDGCLLPRRQIGGRGLAPNGSIGWVYDRSTSCYSGIVLIFDPRRIVCVCLLNRSGEEQKAASKKTVNKRV